MFKAVNLWLPSYLRREKFRRAPGVTDIMIAICDHFEPLHKADKPIALERIRRWKNEFPKLVEPFRDADQRVPRYSFFYPIERYDKDILSKIKELCDLCDGEVEIHLHHRHDTAETLREKLERGKNDFAQHGLLARDRAGNLRYGFIHGDWALDNSHPDGRNCGVSNEIGVLKATGCYADFTLPSVPSPTQTRTINQIYYATDTPEPKSHDLGVRAKVKSAGEKISGDLLLVQGPLGLNWERRKFGVIPRIENGELTGANPPTPARMRLWMRLGIHVQAQPNWVFIKLHTHGGIPENMVTLLADPMRRFYEYLSREFTPEKKYRLHFVTAREMVNIVHAAEDGKTGDAGKFRDYTYLKNSA